MPVTLLLERCALPFFGWNGGAVGYGVLTLGQFVKWLAFRFPAVDAAAVLHAVGTTESVTVVDPLSRRTYGIAWHDMTHMAFTCVA